MTRTIREFSDLDSCDRRVTLLSTDSLSGILPLPQLASECFAMFLAMDGRAEATKDLAGLAAQLIKQGLVYLCAWGPDCERVHDIFDEEEVGLEIETETGNEYAVMTVWHDKESLDDALWFFLNSTEPDERYADRCGHAFVVSVGNKEWTNHLADCLSDIEAFNKRVLDSDETEE